MYAIAFVIPILICLYYKIKFQKNVTWLEFLGSLIAVPIIVGLLVMAYIGFKGHDSEIISGYIVGKKYIPEHQEMRTRTVCTGSGKNQSCHTEVYWVTIPDDWDIYTGHYKPTNFSKGPAAHGGEEYGDQEFGGGIDCTREKYYSTQVGDLAVWTRFFVNPLKLSENTLFRRMNDKKFPGLKAPEVYNYNDMNRITLLNGLSLNRDWHVEVNRINSELLNTNINIGLIFTKYDSDFLEYLQTIWRGGNPNDFIITMCVDNDKKIWKCKIIAWDNEYLKITVKDEILNSVKNAEEIDKILTIVKKNVVKIGFKEKDLSKFNYMKVELPVSFLIVLYIMTIVATVAILEWERQNEFYD